jgi:hypothetical protein
VKTTLLYVHSVHYELEKEEAQGGGIKKNYHYLTLRKRRERKSVEEIKESSLRLK